MLHEHLFQELWLHSSSDCGYWNSHELPFIMPTRLAQTRLDANIYSTEQGLTLHDDDDVKIPNS